ncbi:hypothetical protein MNV49_000921 [Pseudohyphozyma bogoriensis]|nr:hypothetical protein MNV49_000921 [Pseudohyphozyma bogoriensis]
MGTPLFNREDTEHDEDEPPRKKSRFFPDDDDSDVDAPDADLKPPKSEPEQAEDVIQLDDSDDDEKKPPVAGPSRVKEEKTPTVKKEKQVDQHGDDKDEWQSKYFGDIIVEGYTLYKASTFCSLKPNEAISLQRSKPDPPPPGKKAPKKEKSIVRFMNSKGTIVGRVAEVDAEWIAKLIDLDYAHFTGTCVSIDKNFSSGASVILSLQPYISRKAFSNANAPRVEPISTTASGKKVVHGDLKENDEERSLREKRAALNKLFDKTNLQPVVSDEKGKKGKGKTGVSKRTILEKYSGALMGKGEEEEEMDDNTLNMVYSKAIKNDAFLPEMDPPETFTLSLRGYQKQALRWMSSMETGEDDARAELSRHPLWEEYVFPLSPAATGVLELEEFYYNPYSGDLSLDFPRASKRCGSGILADEMGLGKTIQMAALLATNTPEAAAARAAERANGSGSASGSGEEDESDHGDLFSEDDNKPYVPSPTKKVRSTQARLGGDGKLKSVISGKGKVKVKAGMPTATLVVAPMTLLSQWCSEIERSTNFRVLLYYGNNRTSIQEEIEGGIDVVVTSYGTLVSDFKASGGGEEAEKPTTKGKEKEKKKALPKVKKRKGLFSVEWFRVVLDEAHLIKSRATQNAKACYALRASRRCFVTLPFEKKDPQAIKIIQVVLESILLRREKKMKDRDGKPIVSLPEKHIETIHLEFSEEERLIYEALYRNAKSKFLGYAQEGTVLQNVTAIFSILMRLRQAVLHPQLVLKRLAQNVAESKRKNRTDAERAADLEDASIVKLITNYGGGSAQTVDELSQEVEAEEEEECCICHDVAETPVYMPKCGHVACRECAMAHFAEQEERGEEPRCPRCKLRPITNSEMLQITQGVQKKPKLSSKKKALFTTSLSSSGPGASSSQTEVLTILDSSEDESALKTSPREAKGKAKAKVEEIEVNSDSSDSDSDSDADYVEKDVKMASASSDEDEDEDEPPSPSANQGLILQKDNFKSSTKLDALIASLRKARAEDPLVKVVVFSQFTGFLDIIERGLSRERFNHVRLDGTMSQKVREKVVNKFTTTAKGMILLASLKAGGVGLNLIAATRVYLMDCWWNAAIENQAIDRIHRFGQTRDVYVTRFLISPSIDDKMIKLQERKTKVINASLGGKKGEGKGELAENFEEIFKD